MRRIIVTVTLSLALALISIPETGGEVGVSDTGEFAIYTLADKSLTVKDVDENNLQELVLSERPLLITQDIVSYARCKHILTVTAEAVSRINELSDEPTIRNGIPFVVTIDGQRSYLGTFWSFTSSSLPTVPRISLPTGTELHIRILDRRDDRRIIEAFESRGILKD